MKLLPVMALMAVVSGASLAQTKTLAPAPGSVERKAILDALRVPVEKDLGQDVVFKLDLIRVKDGWAFLRGVPRRPDGGAIN